MISTGSRKKMFDILSFTYISEYVDFVQLKLSLVNIHVIEC